MTALGARVEREVELTFDLSPDQLLFYRDGVVWARLFPGDKLMFLVRGEILRFEFPWRRQATVAAEPHPNGDLTVQFNNATDLEDVNRRLARLMADFERLQTQTRALAEPDPAERARRDRLAAENAAIRAKKAEEYEAAEKRATELLLTHLTDKQREQYARLGKFEVKGQHLTYEISAHGVQTKEPYGTFCIGALARVPHGDELLAYKLMIESDEAEFLRCANWSGGAGGSAVQLGRMSIKGKPTQDVFRSRIYGGGSIRRGLHGPETVAGDEPYLNPTAQGVGGQLTNWYFTNTTNTTVTRNYVDATTFGEATGTYLTAYDET